MENRLELNKKNIYELPDEVLIDTYEYSTDKKRYREPVFAPDVCICIWGRVGKVESPRSSSKQIWVKTENKDLMDFIMDYNWKKEAHKTTILNLNVWKFKKIILEEFYNKK